MTDNDNVTTADAPDDGRCEAEFIDGTWYGDGCPECRDSVARASDDCETCIQAAQDDDAEPCSLHGNGCWS